MADTDQETAFPAKAVRRERSGQIESGILRTERERKLRLQQEGIAAKEAETAAAQRGLRDAETFGRRGIRRAAARNQAALLAGTPAGSGAGLSIARQGAQSTADTLGGFEVGLGGLRQQAAEARSAELAFKSEAASPTADTQENLALADDKIASIIKNNKGFFGDDEDQMGREMITEARRSSDPVVADRFLMRAMDVQKGGDLDGKTQVVLSDGTIYTTKDNPENV